MAGNRIANDLEHFKSDINTIETLIVQMNGSYKRVFDEMVSLTNMWEGMAQKAFLTRFAEDAEKIASLLNLLEEDLKGLEDARQKYQKCELQVEELIRALKVEAL